MASITWAGTSGSVLDEDHPSNGQANSGESIERGLKDIKADEVIASRTGDVLGRHTMLKADHFPSCHNTKLIPIVEGAPNFRQVDSLPVFGVAIPTVTGLRRVLNLLGASKGQRKVYWQNLREEPLVFINGNPFVVRESDNPFANLEYTGIDRSRVEHMELRLKQDILTEARQFGNNILVVHENEDLSIFDHWEPVTPADVQTPNELFAELRADGYDIDYLRVPVTDEKAPKDSDFELLIQRLWCVPAGAALVFNCQMGRGRTTTGMIIASMLYLRRLDAFPKPSMDTADLTPHWFQTALANPPAVGEQTRDKLRHGMYDVVRSLLRVLEQGTLAKVVLDAAVDACSGMQNLREAIGSYRARFLKETRERQRNTLMNVCLEYLERYYMLIAFASYLASPSFNPTSLRHVSFPDWMARRPELRSILMRLLRRNSMAALEVHTPVDGIIADSLQLSLPHGPGDNAANVIAERSGAVLGPFTILKEDNFPGMASSKIEQLIDGAPNFRSISGLPVYGLGMPTVEGIVSVLKMISGLKGSSSANSTKQVHALWVNMREEPVVYIKGLPFVLREEVRPLKNMQEYAGIEADRLGSMEERLKKDVLAEAEKFGGRVLVAHESQVQGHYGELFDTWEVITSNDQVQTSKEVYASLASQGFSVKYVRVPVTDGTSPSLADFDATLSNILDFGLENPVIFNCQMGIGRTTAGMVIASLVHLYSTGCMGQDERATSSKLEGLDALNLSGYIMGGISPRSDNEGDEFREEDDEKESKVWDFEPEEIEEQKSLASGGFVGVRRVARLLEEGESAKRTLDAVIDAASDLINLRVAIIKYRKPRSSYKYMRPEMQQRHSAFKKGSAYLERYCLLIAFSYYLEHVGPESGTSFSAWAASRPDLLAAFAAIHQNPAAALAAVPVAKVLTIYQSSGSTNTCLQDQRLVLSRRKGRLLTKRTILKSYMQPNEQPHLPQIPDLRQADGAPVFSIGNISRAGMQLLLEQMGAGPDGSTTVIISDVREELVLYVNGTPYLRRELEMPAAALHHAGIHATQLEELETLLKEDMLDESALWGGRVLLHRETLQPEGGAAGGGSSGKRADDDVTALVDLDPSTSVAPFWEVVDNQEATSLQTPREVLEGLLAEGYKVSYRRIPLSRERTPEAEDVDQLHEQLVGQLGKAPHQAQTGSPSRPPSIPTLHLILSRTATGSSARFVAAVYSSYHTQPRTSSSGLLTSRQSLPTNFALPLGFPRTSLATVSSGSGGYGSGCTTPTSVSVGPGPAPVLPVVSSALDVDQGEYRGIMSLCRLLPGGFDAKLTVDLAVSRCNHIGNLLADIRKCKMQAEEQPAGKGIESVGEFAARQLGVHYLKRYFLLIAYRVFLEHRGSKKGSFGDWMQSQKELAHLADHLTLDS